MWIDLDDAVRVYARMLRARFGPGAAVKAAQESVKDMRARADLQGVRVWEAVALELAASYDPSGASDGSRSA